MIAFHQYVREMYRHIFTLCNGIESCKYLKLKKNC